MESSNFPHKSNKKTKKNDYDKIDSTEFMKLAKIYDDKEVFEMFDFQNNKINAKCIFKNV